MRSRRVTRYYCDYCSKGMLQKLAMERHEACCFRNPQRESCPVCENRCDEPSIPVLADLIDEGADGQFARLSDEVNGCPACILSAVIQFNDRVDPDEWVEFDYKAAKCEWDKEKTTKLEAMGLGGYAP